MMKIYLVMFLMCGMAGAAGVAVDAQSTIDYLLSCQKENGAFGPLNQEYSDLSWNYPAVHALILLDQEVPRAADALENGRFVLYEVGKGSHGPAQYWFIYQKAMVGKLLGGDGPIPGGRSWSLGYSAREGATKLVFTEGRYKDISSMWHYVGAILATDGTISNGNEIRDVTSRWQTGLGGYASGYGNDPVMDKDANIIATHHAVMTLTSIGQTVPNQADVISFLQACQTESGGFRWHPANDSYGNKPDVYYTWAAIRALQALGSEPADVPGCLNWLNSLQNADGGFGDRPGWLSRIYSTYYAVHALELLTGDAVSAITSKLLTLSWEPIPEDTYNIYVTHFKAPEGSVDDMWNWGFTMHCPRGEGVINDINNRIEDREWDMLVAYSPENRPHNFKLRGGATTNHASNWVKPPNLTSGQNDAWNRANDKGNDNLHWDEFKEQVLKPTFELGTLFWPELEWTMLDAYMMNDEGLDGNPGWNVVVAALGWKPWDWLRSYPFRERWIGQLPIIADGDAHGNTGDWKMCLSRQRTLYLAEDNSWESFLEAFRENRVVTVIHDHDDGEHINPAGAITTIYGPPEVVRYVQIHQDEWRWEEVPEFTVDAVLPESHKTAGEKVRGMFKSNGSGFLVNGRLVSKRFGRVIYFNGKGAKSE